MTSIFGITNDNEFNEDAAIVAKLRQRKKKLIADSKYRVIQTPIPEDKLDPATLATNVVDLAEEDISQLKAEVEALTLEYSDFLRQQILPHLLAFDAAVDYTQVLLTDGLGRHDVATDNSLMITLKWLLHTKMVNFFQDKLNLDAANSAEINEKLAELLKTELAKPTGQANPTTVGLIRQLGMTSLKSSV